jgi:ribosomal protein L37AE/L43A
MSLSDRNGRPFRDFLPEVRSLRLQAMGLITRDSRDVEVAFGDFKRRVKVGRLDLANRGFWACFICPSCDRRVRVLRLHDGRITCRHCDGLDYAKQSLPPSVRVARLEALLARGKIRKRPIIEARLRRAKIEIRRKALRGFDPDAPQS